MNFLKNIILIVLFLLGVNSYAQKNSNKSSRSVVRGSEEYGQMKMNGKLESLGKIIVKPSNSLPSSKKGDTSSINSFSQKKTSSCYGYFPPNPSTPPDTVGDDNSIEVPLPFNFCFYGNSYNSVWVNDNGTASFNAAHGAFTAQGFPFDDAFGEDEIIAPFWADFHQAGALSGNIYYEVLSDAIIIHWVDVGYYNAKDDKLNTMMLILTDGTSPLLQPGSNVGFFYEDMQWTTGDASFGVNGFGGTEATVGVNRGDGVDYIQIGRFDGPGNSYDGPFNQSDSVDWLDNKTFMFNVCNSNNIAPIVVGIDFCDTLRVCVGDTLPINVTFLAPESNQVIWASVDTSQASGFQITSNTTGTGPSGVINSTFVGDTSNVGVNILTFMAYDNGTPSDTIQFDYIIVVDSISMIPFIIGDTSYCQGNSVALDGGVGFDSYLWSNGDTSQAINITQGSYVLQASLGGCTMATDSFKVIEFSNPVVQIIGDTLYCTGDSVLLNATPDYDTYLWNTSVNDTLDSIYVTQGNYTVTVTDTNTCVGTSNVFAVFDFSNTVNILGDTTYCLGDSVLLNAGIGYDTYLWNTGVNDTLENIYVTQGTYSVTVSAYGCVATDSHTVSMIPVPIPLITGDTAYCQGSGALVDAGVGYDDYLWDTSPTQSNQIISITQQGIYTVTVTIDGCPATSLPFTIIENALPTPLIAGNLNYCLNDSAGTTLSTVNTYTQYSWSSGEQTSSVLVIASPPAYYVVVTDSNGCAGISPSVVVTNSAPVNNITGVTTFCQGETITINATPGFTSYLWNNNAITPSINVGGGTYMVTVTDGIGCTDTDTIVIIADAKPIASFSIDPSDHGKTNEITVVTDLSIGNGGNIIDWNWNFNFTNNGGVTPLFSITQGPHSVVFDFQGSYGIWLEVISDNGCKDTSYIDYLVIDDVIASNVFTPNNDGLNDFLVFKNLEFQPSNHLIVFDRWGRNIFESNNYNNDWDGNDHPPGTYFYILTVPEIEPIKGSFTILR